MKKKAEPDTNRKQLIPRVSAFIAEPMTAGELAEALAKLDPAMHLMVRNGPIPKLYATWTAGQLYLELR